ALVARRDPAPVLTVRPTSFVDSVEPFAVFHRYTGFELCAVLFPLCQHLLSPHLLSALPLTQQFYLKNLSSFRGTLYSNVWALCRPSRASPDTMTSKSSWTKMVSTMV